MVRRTHDGRTEMRTCEISYEATLGSILFATSLRISTSSGPQGLARNMFKRFLSVPFGHQITFMNSFTGPGGTRGHISQDEPRASGECAIRQAEFAARANSNQRQLSGKLKATFTPEECKILGRIINRFCNFLGASSPLERRLIEKLRRLTAGAKISEV